eukprot:6819182-Prymnesium_polylepis.1
MDFGSAGRQLLSASPLDFFADCEPFIYSACGVLERVGTTRDLEYCNSVSGMCGDARAQRGCEARGDPRRGVRIKGVQKTTKS